VETSPEVSSKEMYKWHKKTVSFPLPFHQKTANKVDTTATNLFFK